MKQSSEEDLFAGMSVGEHLDELRYRLAMMLAGAGAGVIVALFLGGYFMGVLVEPYRSLMASLGEVPELQAIGVSEKFVVYLKTSLIVGLFLGSPWLFYHLWQFVGAGLYRREKRLVYWAVPVSAGLFVGGGLFFLKVIGPMTIRFFVGFDAGVDFVRTVPTLSSYIDFVLSLTLIFGGAFQLPIGVVFAEKMGVVTVGQLAAARKYVLFGLVVLAAIATPPDVVSQIALAVPLYVLYEGSVWVCRLRGRKAAR